MTDFDIPEPPWDEYIDVITRSLEKGEIPVGDQLFLGIELGIQLFRRIWWPIIKHLESKIKRIENKIDTLLSRTV